MFCPSTIVFNSNRLLIIRHEKSDYHRGTPWGEVLNPLRYSFTWNPGTERRITINKNGRWALRWADWNWRIWRRHLHGAPF